MNTPLFIAKRLIRKESTQKELSKPIVRIATIGVALGMAVMILSIAIVTGFQREIRQKVIGFGSHIQITPFGTSKKNGEPKLPVDQAFYPYLDTVAGVKHINIFALKEGVLETDDNIQGILAKGVSTDYDWSFLRSKMVRGDVLHLSDTATSDGMLLSAFLAGRLRVDLGDKVPIYFQNAKGGMSQRNFTIEGIFDTGLKEMDEEFVFVDINQIRKLNQWGVEAHLVYRGCKDGRVSLSAKGFGGDGRIRLKWSVDSLRGEGPYTFCLDRDTVIYVVATDHSETIGDTAFFRYEAPPLAGKNRECHCPDKTNYSIHTTGGSAKYYTGGFEVQLDGYDILDKMDEIIYKHLNYDLKTTTIKQHLPEIFNWLNMLDINTWVIIVLMIVISIINMTSALLILIMERTNMIGMLKALGARTWFIQRIFIIQAAYIITIGLIVGNALGIGLGLLQRHFGLIKLDPENYYVATVPVWLDPGVIVLLNVLTLIVCVTAMLLPSLIVAQIRPSKAIRFD